MPSKLEKVFMPLRFRYGSRSIADILRGFPLRTDDLSSLQGDLERLAGFNPPPIRPKIRVDFFTFLGAGDCSYEDLRTHLRGVSRELIREREIPLLLEWIRMTRSREPFLIQPKDRLTTYLLCPPEAQPEWILQTINGKLPCRFDGKPVVLATKPLF